jgi:hypothetical protein
MALQILRGVHPVLLTYNLIIVFPSQYNYYQNLIHIYCV